MQPCRSALLVGLAMSLMLLAGCDSAALESPSPQTHALAGGSNAQARVAVCHVDGKGEYGKITIAEAAYETHVAHGDGGIGDAVPGMEGYKFDEDCQPVVAECPCFDAGDLSALGSPDFSDYEDGDYWTTSVVDAFLLDWAEAKKDVNGYSCSYVYGGYVGHTNISQGAAETCRGLLFVYKGW